MMPAPKLWEGLAALRAVFRRLTLEERLQQRMEEAALETILADEELARAREQSAGARSRYRDCLGELHRVQGIARARDTGKQ